MPRFGASQNPPEGQWDLVEAQKCPSIVMEEVNEMTLAVDRRTTIW